MNINNYINSVTKTETQVDPLTGCTVRNLAKFVPSWHEPAPVEAKEIAVIAFWRPDQNTGVLDCYHFFNVPNPMKRMVQDQKGTQLYEVLYQGQDG